MRRNDTLTESVRMFGTSEAVAHREFRLMDEDIAKMTREQLEALAYSPDGSIRTELYHKEDDGRKWIEDGVHRAKISLMFLDGEIEPKGRADCPYARHVNAWKRWNDKREKLDKRRDSATG
jgi:hypothetical protein